MKKALLIILSLICLTALAACNSNADNNAKNQSKAEENLKNGYNFIQPKVSLGMKRADMPAEALPANAPDPLSVAGNPVEYQGVNYNTMYSWMGGDALKLIEYSSTDRLSGEQYDALLETMNGLYGEPRLLSEVDAEIYGEDIMTDASPSPAEPSETPTATESSAPSASSASTEIVISASEQPASSPAPRPALTWRYENVNISLYDFDGKAIIDLILN